MNIKDIPEGDGTFEIPLGKDCLSVLKKGFEGGIGPFFLVAFNGAVSMRGKVDMKPPFFSGVRIAHQVGLPLLSFSDPTMAHDDTLKLAFYAGSRKAPDLPDVLARAVDQVAQQTGSTPILMGGSGGGFAALNVGYRCNSDAFALVWNPQTRVSRYDAHFVAHYIDVAFPGSRDKEQEISAEAEQILTSEGILDAVMDIRKPLRTIYFQNITDWHVNAHLKPFLEGLDWRFVEGKSGLLCDRMDLAVCLGGWGQGHAPVSRDIILDAIRQITNHASPAEIAESILLSPESDIGDMDVDLTADDITLDIQRQNGKIDVTMTLSKPCAGVQYAFYLMQNQTALKKVWYRDNPSTSFLDTGEEDLKVTGFVRKFDGEVYRKTVDI